MLEFKKNVEAETGEHLQQHQKYAFQTTNHGGCEKKTASSVGKFSPKACENSQAQKITPLRA